MGFTPLVGQRSWSMTMDDVGHRDYKLVTRVVSSSPRDGPALARLTPGLHLPGAPWIVDNDVDLWAWCRPTATVTPVLVNEPNRFFDVEQTFSTRPPDVDRDPTGGGGGPGGGPGDPLLELPQISGGFTKGKVEATHNFNGVPILTSSHEQLRGPQVEFDANNPTIRIKQNLISLNLPLLCLMVDTVNYLPLWGLPPRCVKLSSASWERKFHGMGSRYYERTLEFDINFKTFDRVLLDEGRKALNGKWTAAGNWELVNINGVAPNPLNPQHFSQFKDRNGENCRVVLNGAGLPSSVLVGTAIAATSYVVGDSVTYQGSTYVCIVSNINVNPATSFALGSPSWKWIKVVGSLGEWQDSIDYVVGNIATRAQEGAEAGAAQTTYIANTASPAGTPFGDNWTELAAGINDRGAWQGRVTPTPSGAAGYVYVAYYLGTNMLLLNIPLTF